MSEAEVKLRLTCLAETPIFISGYIDFGQSLKKKKGFFPKDFFNEFGLIVGPKIA